MVGALGLQGVSVRFLHFFSFLKNYNNMEAFKVIFAFPGAACAGCCYRSVCADAAEQLGSFLFSHLVQSPVPSWWWGPPGDQPCSQKAALCAQPRSLEKPQGGPGAQTLSTMVVMPSGWFSGRRSWWSACTEQSPASWQAFSFPPRVPPAGPDAPGVRGGATMQPPG